MRRWLTLLAIPVVAACVATSAGAPASLSPTVRSAAATENSGVGSPAADASATMTSAPTDPAASAPPATAVDSAAPADGGDDEPGILPPPEASAPPAPSGATTALGEGRLTGEPDPALTPGVLNPAVTQTTIRSTICVTGWTATIRPSSSYTTSLKLRQISRYGYANTSTAAYEEDHLIPLELGGAPADPANLWPQPWDAFLADGRKAGARTKDAYETSLRRQVCAGSLTLARAQSLIGVHWVHAYYGIPLSSTPR